MVAVTASTNTLGTKRAAAYLRERGLSVTDQTLRRWADEKKIAHLRLPSKQLRFRPVDLDALLEPIHPDSGDAA